MRVHKGEVLTIRLRVEDPEAASPFLGALVGSMLGAPHNGCMVTASSRGDVFRERDEFRDCCGCAYCACDECEGIDEDEDEQDDGANYA